MVNSAADSLKCPRMFMYKRTNAVQDGLPLRIIEIGGGNGTLAKDMLVRCHGLAGLGQITLIT